MPVNSMEERLADSNKHVKDLTKALKIYKNKLHSCAPVIGLLVGNYHSMSYSASYFGEHNGLLKQLTEIAARESSWLDKEKTTESTEVDDTIEKKTQNRYTGEDRVVSFTYSSDDPLAMEIRLVHAGIVQTLPVIVNINLTKAFYDIRGNLVTHYITKGFPGHTETHIRDYFNALK